MADQSQTVLINRPPRIQPDLPQSDNEIPPPPETDKGGQQLIQLFLPLITIIAYVLVSATGQGRNIALIIPMGLSVIASSGLGFWTYHKNQRETQRKREAYETRLAELRREMENAHDQQRTFYYYNYPNIETVKAIAANRETGDKDNRTGTRLWERRTSDPDFGAVRLGIGTQPSTVTYWFKQQKNDEDALEYEATKLAEDSRNVTSIPVVVPLRRFKPDANAMDFIPGRHSIGIAGKNSKEVYDFVRAMLVNFTAFHAPTDTRLYVFGAPDSEANWNWARYLPHCNTGNSQEPGDQLNFKPRQSAIENFWDMMIKGDLERRLIRMADDAAGDVTLPFLLVVVDALSIESNPTSPAKGADAQEAASLIFRRGQELGATIIFLMPDAKYIPSQCDTVIEVDSSPTLYGDLTPSGTSSGTLFRYTEVGLNTRRVIGVADTMSADEALRSFALKLTNLSVRSTFGTAGLPNGVLLLALHEHIKGGNIDASAEAIHEKWKASREPANSEWLRVPVGFMPGPKQRDLTFSANGDGVHGMIAGTTGSGKSEMLITLILGLAMRYDPSVVNFVLVDYKGGSAFKMFEGLPHVVNIVTSLQGNAGARTFIALKSEMKRRAKMLADNGTPHIIQYRENGYHRADLPQPADARAKPAPFPFLFVIIDEFAEMVKEMPEFRGELDSVTRLGRALGVSLILATQRPTGAVTDQMRANIKFKICLRVETPEDSRELLRSSEAAYLPTGVPGRAYLQVGNDNSLLMQVAYASYKYKQSANPEDERPPVIRWFDRQKAKVKKQEGGDVRSIADRVVEICAEIANTKSDVVKQEKPWPDPLPVYVPLNAERISAAMRKVAKVADPLADAEEEGEDEATIIADEEQNPLLPLNRSVIDWLRGNDRWLPVVWDSDNALKARIGMVDDPHHARQLPLDLDLKAGSVLLFGASGKGKTGFLRTLVTSLAVSHSPEALWVYALDFGGGGLSPLAELPHVGAVIGNEEGERVERLINRLKDWSRERSELFGGDSLTVYNKMHPTEIVPAVLVLIDNFAEFRQSYEDLIPDLSSLIREGLSKGIYFAVTADQLGSVPGRTQSLFNQKMTLKLADAADYSGVVGRVAQDLDDIPGRGYMVVDRLVLEMQIAKPAQVEGLTNVEGEPLDDSGQLAYLISLMKKAWRGTVLPQTIDKLATTVRLEDLVDQASDRRLEVMLGIERRELIPVPLNLKEQGPHFIVSGSPFSGKTTTLRTMILSLAERYSPDRAAFILVDAQKKLFDYAEGRSLAVLPHVQLAISEQNRELVEPMIESLKQTFVSKNGTALPEIFVFIDNYDDFSDLFDRKSKPLTDLANVARRYGSEGLHVVIATGSSASEDLFKVLTRSKTGLALDAEAAGKPPFNLTAASKLAKLSLPVGRGFLISSAKANMIQVSTPYVVDLSDENADAQELQAEVNAQLDKWVDRIVNKWDGAPRWTFQLTMADPSGEKPASGGGAGSRAAAPSAPKGPQLPDTFVAKLRGAVKELVAVTGMMSEKDVDALDVIGVVNAADAMDDMIEWGALAKDAGVNPEELVPVLVAMGSPEADARKKFGLAVETPEAVANGATAGTTEQP